MYQRIKPKMSDEARSLLAGMIYGFILGVTVGVVFG